MTSQRLFDVHPKQLHFSGGKTTKFRKGIRDSAEYAVERRDLNSKPRNRVTAIGTASFRSDNGLEGQNCSTCCHPHERGTRVS